MNRNSQNHFRNIPDIDIKRSRFHRPHTHKTTFNTGDLIPFYVDEILPGDTVQMNMAAAVRMATPIFPVMDNAYLDTYYFYVPFRLVWEHFQEFMGENKLTAWEQPTEYEIPQIEAPEGGWTEGTIADYMGIPTKVDNISISSLYFRRYCAIWNEWFRDQNLKDAAMVNLDETTVTGTNSGDYVTNAQLGALPLKAARFHSYFTSALPEPQKGPDVPLPLGNELGLYPIITSNMHLPQEWLTDQPNMQWAFKNNGTGEVFGNWDVSIGGTINNVENIPQNSIGTIRTELQTYTYKEDGATKSVATSVMGNNINTMPLNLWADTTKDINGSGVATINMLRQAFAVQRLYERDARGGTRFREIMRAHFGVTTPDARVQIPEYLGGSRHQINIDQVVQTSSTDATSPQGNTSAYSLTNFADNVFTKSFVEPGILMGVMCVRTDEGYQQGIERFWSRKSRFDFYYPALANIGEQPIYNKELYAQGTSEDDEVFGYQEAWADYRYKPNRVSGLFRSNADGTLDSWHYYNDFETMPTLSSEFIDEPMENLNRTIAVQNEPQFIADLLMDGYYTRPMPLYSVPGLLDHN